MKEIEFWFSIGSTYTYLSVQRIEKIEKLARGDVRRAKLYYLRDRIGKKAKIREKRED